MRFAILGLLLIATPAIAETTEDAVVQPMPLPTWMSGCWDLLNSQGHTMECWTPPQGSMLFGSSITMSGGEAVFWETMQISNDGDGTAPLVFWAAPKGEGRTAFPLESYSNGRLRFVNAENDYPQQIEYWREGELLVGQISQLDGSRTIQWQYMRQDLSKLR